jgi:polar amino acid transport system substrate-binding protein
LRAHPLALALAAGLLLTACGSSSTSSGGGTVTPPPSSDLVTAGTLTFGSDIEYPPQEYYDPPGSSTAVGFDVDLGKALAAKMGLQFAIQNDKFDPLIPDLKLKKFDAVVSAMTDNTDREAVVDFVDYFIAGQSYVVAKGSIEHPTKLTDLCGKTVAVEKGTTEEDTITAANKGGGACASNKVKVSSYDTDTEASVQLKKGTVVIHYTDSPVAGYELKHDSALVVSGGVFAVAPEGFAVRKGDTAMLTAIKAAFKALEDDGTYDRLLDKWGLRDGDIRKGSPTP